MKNLIKIIILVLAVIGMIGIVVYNQAEIKKSELISSDDYYIVKMFKSIRQPGTVNEIRTRITVDKDFKISYELSSEGLLDNENNKRYLSNQEIKKLKSFLEEVKSTNMTRYMQGKTLDGAASITLMIDLEEKRTLSFSESEPPTEKLRELALFLYEAGKKVD